MLFLRLGSTLRHIFERTMADSVLIFPHSPTGEPSAEEVREALADWDLCCPQADLPQTSKAVLQVVPQTDGYNDLRVVERQFFVARDGTVSRQTVIETWSWDAALERLKIKPP
jgi:hypothetical protein